MRAKSTTDVLTLTDDAPITLRWQPELLRDTDTWWCLCAARDEVTKQGKSPSRAAYLAFAEHGLAWARTARNRAEAAQALTTRRRPSSTIPRGLYDTARPWLDLGVTIGDCPRCRSTVTISETPLPQL